jgi:hypothetical protein
MQPAIGSICQSYLYDFALRSALVQRTQRYTTVYQNTVSAVFRFAERVSGVPRRTALNPSDDFLAAVFRRQLQQQQQKMQQIKSIIDRRN